jgi:hypothetical protein
MLWSPSQRAENVMCLRTDRLTQRQQPAGHRAVVHKGNAAMGQTRQAHDPAPVSTKTVAGEQEKRQVDMPCRRRYIAR